MKYAVVRVYVSDVPPIGTTARKMLEEYFKDEEMEVPPSTDEQVALALTYMADIGDAKGMSEETTYVITPIQ